MMHRNAILATILTLVTSTSLFAQQLETERRAPRPLAQEGSVSGGAKLGFADIKDLGNPVFTVGAYGETAVLNNVLAGISLDYWSKSTGTLTSDNVNLDALSLGVTGKYLFHPERMMVYPYALAGLALHRFAREDRKNTDTGLKKTFSTAGRFGLDYGGGVRYPIKNQLDVNAEVRMRNILSSTDRYDHVTLAGGLAYQM